MWFKKQSVLQGEGHYNNNTGYDGTDWRTNRGSESWPVSETLPSAADAGNYFYLPALGCYDDSGQLDGVGVYGLYWSSSANPWETNQAYYLFFRSSTVLVSNGYRNYGRSVGVFE